MAKKLYLVRGNDADGENQDLFVVAPTRGDAVHIWNGYCIAQEWPREDDDAGYAGDVEPAHVREILPDATGTSFDVPDGAYDWDRIPIV